MFRILIFCVYISQNLLKNLVFYFSVEVDLKLSLRCGIVVWILKTFLNPGTSSNIHKQCIHSIFVFIYFNLLHIGDNVAWVSSLFLHFEFAAYQRKCCMSFISVFTFWICCISAKMLHEFHLCFYILNLLHISENATWVSSLFLHFEFVAYQRKCCMSFIFVFTFWICCISAKMLHEFHLCFYILNLLHISGNAAKVSSLFLHFEFAAYCKNAAWASSFSSATWTVSIRQPH